MSILKRKKIKRAWRGQTLIYAHRTHPQAAVQRKRRTMDSVDKYVKLILNYQS